MKLNSQLRSLKVISSGLVYGNLEQFYQIWSVIDRERFSVLLVFYWFSIPPTLLQRGTPCLSDQYEDSASRGQWPRHFWSVEVRARGTGSV
jgi:hypothetical protein